MVVSPNWYNYVKKGLLGREVVGVCGLLPEDGVVPGGVMRALDPNLNQFMIKPYKLNSGMIPVVLNLLVRSYTTSIRLIILF